MSLAGSPESGFASRRRGPYAYAPDQRPEGERAELLLRVAPRSVVLDIGSWSGFAGAFLIENRGAVVDGVEPDAEMATLAARRYRRVTTSPIEDAMDSLLSNCSGEYTTLLFLDVLEHLAEPRRVLESCRRLVAPGGHALFSIPNVAHWSVRKELLLGRWQYRDSGILDRTHLRFYTIDSAEKLLSDSGWSVTWRGTSLDQPPLVKLPRNWLRLLSRWPRLFAAQSLFDGRPR